MSALAAARNTAQKADPRTITRHLKVAASTIIYQGSLVALDASGFAIPAAGSTGLQVAGRAEETVDNSTGSAGDLSVDVTQGVHKWGNKGGDLVTQALVGRDCYMEDDQTVRLTATASSSAGKVEEIDADGGVWVFSGF